jgi:hypothetical protein
LGRIRGRPETAHRLERNIKVSHLEPAANPKDMTNTLLGLRLRTVTSIFALLSETAALGCGNATVDALEPRYASAADCPSNWQVVLDDGATSNNSLVEQDGKLYLFLQQPPASVPSLVSMPATGGPPTVLTSAAKAASIWIDQDRLILYNASDGTARFQSVPLVGGEPQLLFDAGAGRSDAQTAGLATITATDFIWTEHLPEATEVTIWRAPRTGLVPVKLGVVSPWPSGPSRLGPLGPGVQSYWLAPATDGVLLAFQFGTTTFVPYDAGPARTLAPLVFPPDAAIGVDEAGVYWLRQRPDTADERAAFEIMLSPTDGGPARSFWSGLPDHTDPVSVMRTKDGGLIVMVLAKMDDLQDHTTIWTIDSGGSARQIACSPAGVSAPPITWPAEAPDAFSFAVYDYSTQKKPIIRIAR